MNNSNEDGIEKASQLLDKALEKDRDFEQRIDSLVKRMDHRTLAREFLILEQKYSDLVINKNNWRERFKQADYTLSKTNETLVKLRCYDNCEIYNKWQCPKARDEHNGYLLKPLNNVCCTCELWKLKDQK